MMKAMIYCKDEKEKKIVSKFFIKEFKDIFTQAQFEKDLANYNKKYLIDLDKVKPQLLKILKEKKVIKFTAKEKVTFDVNVNLLLIVTKEDKALERRMDFVMEVKNNQI